MYKLNKAMDTLSIIKGLYDFVRVVDPIRKKVVFYKGDDPMLLTDSCHNSWGKGKACENCIAIRSYNLEDTFIKVQYNKEKMFMVTASPMEIDGHIYIFELIKDITNAGIICNLEKRSVSEIIAVDSEENLTKISIKLNETDEIKAPGDRRLTFNIYF